MIATRRRGQGGAVLRQAEFELADRAQLRRLVHDHGWVTLVSDVEGVPVVSHLPVILDHDHNHDDVAVLGHLARADADLHELGRHPVAIVVQGPHGYISPTWYQAGPYVPTWNFVVAHLHGTPELLGSESTYHVLDATVDHFEARRPVPWRMDTVTDYARSIAPYTTGFRLVPERIVGKAKLSQDKPPAIVDRVVAGLHDPSDVHHNPALAAAMQLVAPSGD